MVANFFILYENIGLSPSGKAQDFDSCITLVRIQLAQLKVEVHLLMYFYFFAYWEISLKLS